MKKALSLVRRGSGAWGAIGAQLAQALASLVLSIAAARALGADGLGVFGLISGGLVLATAIATGLVGDSLTVLDRARPETRAGLQIVAFVCAALAGVIAFVSCWAANLLTWQAAAVFGIGSAIFVFEEFLRRLLMASLRFWAVMIVDASGLVAILWWLLIVHAVGSIDMMQILLALLVSQVVAIGIAFTLLPKSEHGLVSWVGADVMSVLRYGAWRAGQQGVRPGMLTAMRILVAVAAGTVAYGKLEGARVYAAPTLLIVNGIGGFLFATYAAKKHLPLTELIRQADHGAVAMFLSVILAGAAAVVLLPAAGSIVTGSRFTIDGVAVWGWVVYSAAAGLLMPYGSLAAVTGMHVKVFMYRLLESVISLTAVGAVVFVFDLSPSWVPLAMTLGPVVLAVVMRQYVLLPQTRPYTDELDFDDLDDFEVAAANGSAGIGNGASVNGNGASVNGVAQPVMTHLRPYAWPGRGAKAAWKEAGRR
jgi:O-antigen/teichoic acid export membrane protein